MRGDMGCSRRRFPIFLPLAIFLFDVLATLVLLSQEAHSASLPRHSGLVLLPGSLFLSGGSAVAFNVGLAGMIEWLSRGWMLTNERVTMFTLHLWSDDNGQDIAEHGDVGRHSGDCCRYDLTDGSHVNNVFSQAASSVQ
jgi:hypothetical protein